MRTSLDLAQDPGSPQIKIDMEDSDSEDVDVVKLENKESAHLDFPENDANDSPIFKETHLDN